MLHFSCKEADSENLIRRVRADITLVAAKEAAGVILSTLSRLVHRHYWHSVWIPFVVRVCKQVQKIAESCDDSFEQQAKLDAALSFGLVLALAALTVNTLELADPPAVLVQEIEQTIGQHAELLHPEALLETSRGQTLAIICVAGDIETVELSEEDLPVRKSKKILAPSSKASASRPA